MSSSVHNTLHILLCCCDGAEFPQLVGRGRASNVRQRRGRKTSTSQGIGIVPPPSAKLGTDPKINKDRRRAKGVRGLDASICCFGVFFEREHRPARPPTKTKTAYKYKYNSSQDSDNKSPQNMSSLPPLVFLITPISHRSCSPPKSCILLRLTCLLLRAVLVLDER